MYITSVSASLTSDAIQLLNRYGILWSQYQGGDHPSLFEAIQSCGERFAGADGHIRFQAAIRELLFKRLLWTDYRAGVEPGVDMYGAHTTALGKCVIRHIWSDLQLPNEMPTGPTFPSNL